MIASPLARSVLTLSATSSPGIPQYAKVTQWGSALDEAKHVVFYFGGLPASSEEPAMHSANSEEDIYQARGIHLVCIDKPGMGGSALAYRFQIRRDWPIVVDRVAEQLKVPNKKYGVMGVSNGGPYVMATLTHPELKHNVKAAAMVVGVSDVWASGYFSWKTPSTFLEGLYNSLPTFVTGPFTALGLLLGKIALLHMGGYKAFNLPEEAKPTLATLMDDSMACAGIPAAIDCQQGLSPLFARSSKNKSPTSVDRNAMDAYGDVRVPVTLWYGTKDSSVPIASAGWLQ